MIIEALANVDDLGRFRLKQFMASLGLGPRQPAVFYRALIHEARAFVHASRQKDRELAGLRKKVEASERRVQELEPYRNSAQELQAETERQQRRANDAETLASALAEESKILRSQRSQRDQEIAELSQEVKRAGLRGDLYEQMLLHLLSYKPMYVRSDPGGPFEVVAPMFRVGDQVLQLVVTVTPGNSEVRTEPLDYKYLYPLLAGRQFKLDDFTQLVVNAARHITSMLVENEHIVARGRIEPPPP